MPLDFQIFAVQAGCAVLDACRGFLGQSPEFAID